jgi:hypothetical protein
VCAVEKAKGEVEPPTPRSFCVNAVDKGLITKIGVKAVDKGLTGDEWEFEEKMLAIRVHLRGDGKSAEGAEGTRDIGATWCR